MDFGTLPAMTITLEQLTGPGTGTALCDHGEGPVWDPATGLFHWVDMLVGRLLSLDPASGVVSQRQVGTVAAAVRPRAGGGLVLALHRQFALLDPGAESPRLLDPLWSDPSIRFNDGGCDRQGRFYCGSMSYGEGELPPIGSLYRLDPDGAVTVLIDGGLTISNGIVWTPDGGTCYYIDSPTRRVDAFDAGPEGSLTGRRPVVEMSDGDGIIPDGMCLDSDGGLWVAMWRGAEVRRYRPDGALDLTVPVPAGLVTACAFGGPDLTDLYITTSRQGAVAPDEEGTAGALFRCRPGFTGVPETPFAG
jgi:sugar lactone lactonase YvrE